MNLQPKSLLKSKTFWAGLGALLTAGTQFATGDATAQEAIQLGFNGALAIFLRMAIQKNFL